MFLNIKKIKFGQLLKTNETFFNILIKEYKSRKSKIYERLSAKVQSKFRDQVSQDVLLKTQVKLRQIADYMLKLSKINQIQRDKYFDSFNILPSQIDQDEMKLFEEQENQSSSFNLDYLSQFKFDNNLEFSYEIKSCLSGKNVFEQAYKFNTDTNAYMLLTSEEIVKTNILYLISNSNQVKNISNT